jgi:DNA-directed RNA polymerase subunit RPC12/RpoP
MADISVGLNCPTCGGAISIPEGENVVNCNYCSSTLFVEGDQGVSTIAFKNKVLQDGVMTQTQSWWRRGWKARDLPKMGKVTEAYPIYLPFWKANTRVAGWICGYEERKHRDQKGNVVRVEKIPKEVMVLSDYVHSEIACDPGDLGIRTLKNMMGETSFADFEMIPTFEATTSKDAAVTRANSEALAKAKSSARVPNVTFERLHVFPRSLTMIYYPVWVVRYSYHDRMYMDTVDGVTGQVLSGRAPGDPLFQSMAMTGGAVVAGLIAAGSIIYGSASGDGFEIPAVGFLIGLGVLFLAYRFFRHGSERVEGEFKEKKASMGQALKQVQDLAKMTGGLR